MGMEIAQRDLTPKNQALRLWTNHGPCKCGQCRPPHHTRVGSFSYLSRSGSLRALCPSYIRQRGIRGLSPDPPAPTRLFLGVGATAHPEDDLRLPLSKLGCKRRSHPNRLLRV